MTINEHDIERFLSGNLPDDHPAWAQTAAFTQRLDTAFPLANGPLDAARLADVVNEARQVRTASALQRNLTPPPVKPARLVLAVAAAAAVAISSGVGMAAALNSGLNQQASDLKMEVPVAPASQLATPEPTQEPSEEASPLETEKPKIVHKTVTHKPKAAAPKPTKKATESHDDHEDGDDEHEGEHGDEHDD